MYHFFVTQDQIGPETITITGPDVNHMKNVLRMKPGEEILISNGVDKDYRCQVETLDSDAVTARILSVDEEGTELPGKIYLFQGLPKHGSHQRAGGGSKTEYGHRRVYRTGRRI